MSENRFLFPKHSPNRVLGRCSLEDVLRKELANKWNSADMDTCKVFTFYLVVEPTHLKNISQVGSFPQVGVKIKNIGNHHLDLL